jgi:hypothetical protein
VTQAVHRAVTFSGIRSSIAHARPLSARASAAADVLDTAMITQ